MVTETPSITRVEPGELVDREALAALLLRTAPRLVDLGPALLLEDAAELGLEAAIGLLLGDADPEDAVGAVAPDIVTETLGVALVKQDLLAITAQRYQQLRIWTIRITPEAGTVKSGEARTVPVHPHLIEQGFLAFVDKAGNGPLFYDPTRIRKPSATNRYVSKVGERLAAWVREKGGVADPNVPPNHGWRHLFKTRALDAGMPERIADAIQGHAPRSIGQTYGRVSLQAMNEALGKLPRLTLD